MNKCLVDLLSSNVQGDRQKLQCFGFILKNTKEGKHAVPNMMSTQKQYFFRSEWDTLRTIVGDAVFRHLYTKYLFFQKTSEGSLVQFAGTNIFEFLKKNEPSYNKYQKGSDDPNSRKVSTCCKYNIKSEKDHYLNNVNDAMWNNMKSRTRIFYCTQFNRNNQFFKKHYLMQNKENKSSADRAELVFKEIFRVNRVRKELKNNVLNILTHMLEKMKDFNFNYYLNKSCPLPENWIERKKKILITVDKTREEKSKYYEELFSYTIENKGVTQFLNEFFYHVLPKNFLTGRNRKNFQKKVKKYVELNKHELIHKNLLLGKINTRDIEWMRFKCSKKNFYYFDRENSFVLWRLFRWIFEDVVVSLIR